MRLSESASLGVVGQVLGTTVWGQQFLGSRFHLAQAAQVTAVGGHIVADTPVGSLFAAIVKIPSPAGMPSFAPRSIESSALASTIFVPTRPSSDILVPLSVALDAGDYALIFGGADTAINYRPFGSTGTGVMPNNNTDLPGASYFHGDAWQWGNDGNAARLRFVVEGELGARTISISKYLYYLFSSREDATPVVFLYDASGAHIAYVYFKSGSQPLPQAQQLPSGQYALYYRRSVLPELIDMLRNEKPIYLHWVPQGTNNTRISTSAEPVGEGEG